MASCYPILAGLFKICNPEERSEQTSWLSRSLAVAKTSDQEYASSAFKVLVFQYIYPLLQLFFVFPEWNTSVRIDAKKRSPYPIRPHYFCQRLVKSKVSLYICNPKFLNNSGVLRGNKTGKLKRSIVDAISYKTVNGNKETANKKWLLVDAEGQVLGRLASRVAYLIRGKHKTNFTPHADCGDNVIVINAEKIRFTGNKVNTKQYVRHTGYPGGQRFESPAFLLKSHPGRIVEYAVRGMLPKNKLGDELFRNLKVYVGPNHDQAAQKPEAIKLETIK